MTVVRVLEEITDDESRESSGKATLRQECGESPL
jgi:hypothetical protein